MGDSEGLPGHHIVSQARKALIALEKCYHVSESRSQLAEAQLARFKLWTANIGVFAKYKASLDYRLRDSPDVQRIILNLLDVLGMKAGLALRAESDLLSSNDVGGTDSRLSDGNETAASTVNTSDPVSDEQAFPNRPRKNPSIVAAYQPVEDTIGRLHRLSTAIRNAGVRNPYSRISRLTIVDENGEDINDLFESYVSQVLRVRYSGLSAVLQRRIADAIYFRRRRFLYNRPSGQRNYEESVPLGAPDEQTAHLFMPSNRQRHSSASNLPQQLLPPAPSTRTASTFYRHRFQNPRLSEPSIVSTAPPQTYVPRMQESIPKPPSIAAGQKEAQCPYCPFVLDAKYFTGTRWIKHFLEDLEPYICLSDDCTRAHELFPSAEQWLAHMKVHLIPSTEWICSMRHTLPGETVMHSPEAFAGHMREMHPGRFTEVQIRSLQARAARPGSMFPNCLFCDWSVPSDNQGVPGSLTPTEEHIANHLLDLALMSVPQMRNTKNDNDNGRDSLAKISLNNGNDNSHSALSRNLSGFDNGSYCSHSTLDEYIDTLQQESMTGAESMPDISHTFELPPLLNLAQSKQMTQGPVLISMESAEDAWGRLPESIKLIENEIMQTEPPVVPVIVSAAQRVVMAQRLRDSTGYLSRLDVPVRYLSNITGREVTVRMVISARIQLMRQFRPGSDWVLADQYSIAPERLQSDINRIKGSFDWMDAHFLESKKASRGAADTEGQIPSWPNLYEPAFSVTPDLHASVPSSSKTVTNPVVKDAPQEVTDEDETYLINCVCRFPHDDGNTICCEKCNKWQHIICYYDDPLSYPETHICGKCQPRAFDIERAKRMQMQQLEEAANEHTEDNLKKRKKSRNTTGDTSKRNRKDWAESSPLPRRNEPEFASDLLQRESEPVQKHKHRIASAPLPRSIPSPQKYVRRERLLRREFREPQSEEQIGRRETAPEQADTGTIGETSDSISPWVDRQTINLPETLPPVATLLEEPPREARRDPRRRTWRIARYPGSTDE